MKLEKFQFKSLKTRVTLITLVFFVTGIWLLSFYASSKLHDDMQNQLVEQQRMVASLLAAEVNNDLMERLSVLEIFAGRISPDMLENPADLQKSLDVKFVIQRYFNAGAFITDKNGTVIGAIAPMKNVIGINFMDREYLSIALKEGKANISHPLIGKVTKTPGFAIATPIKDSTGEVFGALVGAIDLSKPNFLDKVTQNSYGKNGYFLLQDKKTRLIITTADKRRVMKSQPPSGVNWLIDRHLQGYENTGVTISPLGVEVLASAKGVPLTDWVLVAALPTSEAFAPLRELQQRIFWVTMLLTVLAGSMTWWMLSRALAPMFSTIKKLSYFAKSDQLPHDLPVTGQDEIGELIASVNNLLKSLRQREESLRESEHRWKFAIEGSGDGLWDWDVASSTVFFSKTWKAMLGYAEDEIGNGLDEWEKRVHPEDKEATLAAVQAHIDGKTPTYVNEHRVLCKDGSYKWILDRGLVVSRDADGKPIRIIGTHTDITERKQLESQIRLQAFYDPLTSLANRRLLIDRLSQSMLASRRNSCYGALLFLDMDNFKPLNDAYGHGAGDMLLIDVANRIKSCVREADTVARVGGDEFVVMLTPINKDKELSKAQALVIAEKIRVSLAGPYMVDVMDESGRSIKVEHHCTASIGVVLFYDELASQDEIIKRADEAMYQAKNAGRNQVRFYDKA